MIPRELLRKVRQIEIRTRFLVTDAFAGEYHSVFRGRGMEFHEVREYIPGDDIRAIDWNVTARTGAPHVKRFIEERELTVLLLVDISHSQAFGSGRQLKRELAAEAAALLALAAVRNNDRVGLVLFAGEVERYLPPAKGLRHVLRLVREVLSHPTHSPGTQLAPALSFLNHTQHRRCVCFLLSDFQSPSAEYQRLLAPTARRHDLIAALIADRREDALPAAGLVEFSDAETGQRYLVDSAANAVRRAYTLERERWLQSLRAMLRRADIEHFTLETDTPYEQEIARFFRRRARRLRL